MEAAILSTPHQINVQVLEESQTPTLWRSSHTVSLTGDTQGSYDDSAPYNAGLDLLVQFFCCTGFSYDDSAYEQAFDWHLFPNWQVYPRTLQTCQEVEKDPLLRTLTAEGSRLRNMTCSLLSKCDVCVVTAHIFMFTQFDTGGHNFASQ